MTHAGPRSLLHTKHGDIHFPAYIPVTTFGEKYPLDDLIRPYLPRLAPAAMVSFYYARKMNARPTFPLFIDSGGFASLFRNSRVLEEDGLGVLETIIGDDVEILRPSDVLEFQEQHADVAFTLDFPIPPSMAADEAQRRQRLTIANATWAISNRRRRDMPLYACVQGWSVSSYRKCAIAYSALGFEGIAVGGLIPRAGDVHTLLKIVSAIRKATPTKPIHVFGLGNPSLVEALFQHGVQSVDSSSYVKLAANGRSWANPSIQLADASPIERLHLALCNLAMATNYSLPLSAAHLAFGSQMRDRARLVR